MSKPQKVWYSTRRYIVLQSCEHMCIMFAVVLWPKFNRLRDSTSVNSVNLYFCMQAHVIALQTRCCSSQCRCMGATRCHRLNHLKQNINSTSSGGRSDLANVADERITALRYTVSINQSSGIQWIFLDRYLLFISPQCHKMRSDIITDILSSHLLT